MSSSTVWARPSMPLPAAKSRTVELRVPGAINVQNALAAIAVARELDFRSCRSRRLSSRFAACAGASIFWRAPIGWWSSTTTRITRPRCVRRSPPRVNSIRADLGRLSAAPLLPYGLFARISPSLARRGPRLFGAVYAASEPAIPGVSERSIGEPLAHPAAAWNTWHASKNSTTASSTKPRAARWC